ncbi:dynein light chain Tctex-type protein 2B-like [Babylonia areolata]|uniref:dynein light chain Tctex-type protein 2B-like n=1 Tax=Babylonia areolata TaxID=304850 RepID=UPI003FD60659
MATDAQDGPPRGRESVVMSRKRRPSNVSNQPDTSGPMIRRMSRLEARPSIQYGPSRRMSYASRSSISGHSWIMGPMKNQQKLANTYRMGPNAEEKFNAAKASKQMQSTLSAFLESEKYDKTLSVSLSKNLAEVIKDHMKDMGFSHRYKYVCMVTMGELKEQGMTVCSRCVWNTDTDNMASATFTKGDLFAVATLYALYFE